MDHIIIGTDSRGKNLQNYISANNIFPCPASVISIPGGRIYDVESAINKLFIGNDQSCTTDRTYIVLAAGICDISAKLKHSGGTQLTYQRQTQVASITTQLQQMSSHFNQFPNTSFIITAIPPISLAKSTEFNISKDRLQHNIFTEEEIKDQQIHLEEDIKLLNKNISQINQSMGMRTIRWDRDIMKTSIKKSGHKKQHVKKITKFNYKHLYDGVHASLGLQHKWNNILCQSILADMMIHTKSDLRKTDEEDCKTGDWDFKRRRTSTCTK